MRLKLKKKGGIKNCYVNLPSNSPFKLEMSRSTYSEDTITLPLKVMFEEQVLFFGYSGGESEDSNTIEIAEDLANYLMLPDGISLEVSIQYTYRHLKKVEFEPMTADDYEIVRHFAEDIEMILLNQIGVFFNGLIFPCYVGPDLQYRILFKVNIKDKLVERMECFMLSLNCEITIPPKTRKAENVKTEEEVQREIIKEKQRKVFENVYEEQPDLKELKQPDLDQDYEEVKDCYNCVLIRDYGQQLINESFYHVYTGIKSLTKHVKVEIQSESIQSFKDFQKDQQNDGSAKVSKESKSYVLIPKYKRDLAIDEILLPKKLNPVFSSDQSSNLKTFDCIIITALEEAKDLEDLCYYLECRFYLSSLDILASTEGESKSIMTIIVKEFFNDVIYNSYSANGSIVILNTGIVLKFTRKNISDILRRMLSKWKNTDESVYHSDQFVGICK